jgi:hypothetical protein
MPTESERDRTFTLKEPEHRGGRDGNERLVCHVLAKEPVPHPTDSESQSVQQGYGQRPIIIPTRALKVTASPRRVTLAESGAAVRDRKAAVGLGRQRVPIGGAEMNRHVRLGART